MNSALAEMFRYNAWANDELFNACRSLTELPEGRVAGSLRSVRELLMHIADGERTFVMRTKGQQPVGPLWAEWPGIDSLIEVVRSASTELITIAEEAGDDDVADLQFQGKIHRFPKCFFLVHAMEHSVEHRTELKVLLAERGIETPDLDGWQYAAAMGYGEEVAPS